MRYCASPSCEEFIPPNLYNVYKRNGLGSPGKELTSSINLKLKHKKAVPNN